MTLEHVGKSQTHVTCGVDTLKPFKQFSILPFLIFIFYSRVPYIDLEIMLTLKSEFDCILKQNAKGGR